MVFTSKVVSGIPVLAPGSDLFGDPDNQALHTEVLRLIETGPKAIVLDLKNVRFVASAGLGLIVAEYRRAKDAGVRLLLANLSIRVKELLYVTRLDTYLKDHGSVEEAIAGTLGEQSTPADPKTE